MIKKVMLNEEQIEFMKGSIVALNDLQTLLKYTAHQLKVEDDRMWSNLRTIFPEIKESAQDGTAKFVYPGEGDKEHFIMYVEDEQCNSKKVNQPE